MNAPKTDWPIFTMALLTLAAIAGLDPARS